MRLGVIFDGAISDKYSSNFKQGLIGLEESLISFDGCST